MRLTSLFAVGALSVLSVTPAIAQTRISWQQAEKLRWHPITRPPGLPTELSVQQVAVPPVSFRVEGGALRVSGSVDCVVTPKGVSGLIYVTWFHNRVSIYSGYNTGSQYVPTADNVTVAGDCALEDFLVSDQSFPNSTEFARYQMPRVQAHLYFGAWGMTQPTAPLKGLDIESAPTSYGIDSNGLLYVRESYSSESKPFVETTKKPPSFRSGAFH